MSWSLALRATVGSLELEVAIDAGAAPVALIGPNGSGKSTLMRLVAGEQLHAKGHIRCGAATFFDSASGVFLAPDQRGVGYVPQCLCLFPHLTALQNVAFGLHDSRKFPQHQSRSRAALSQLQALGAGHLASSFPSQLSGGEQQRVALARALVVEPAWLLLDEPLAALDLQGHRTIRRYLAARLGKSETASLIVTHDARDIAALGAEVCVLSAGRVIQRGTAAEVRRDPASEFVAEFFSADRDC